jgi:antitoxin component of MazEF toxin-antitoxin module
MERHIFKFGENSIALILPKKWIDKSGLKPSGSVFLSESESGNLIVSPKETAKQEAERVITSKTRPSFAARWVGIHYMYGVGKLRIYSADGLTSAQTEAIGAKVSAECPGFEITSQSNRDIIIEDFTNIREVDIEKILLRLRSLINQEFMEMAQGSPKTIPKIETLVNRFYMLGFRYVNITQAKDALTYFGALNFMEDISDKLEELSKYFKADGKQVFGELRDGFELSAAAMKGDGKAIEKVAELRESMSRKLSNSKYDRVHAKILLDVANDISKIAEFGLRSDKEGGEVLIPPSRQ